MSCIVHGKPLLKVLCGASVMVAPCSAVSQDIDVVELWLCRHRRGNGAESTCAWPAFALAGFSVAASLFYIPLRFM